MRTKHGHEIPGTPYEPAERMRLDIVDCGGIGGCIDCATDSVQTIINHRICHEGTEGWKSKELQESSPLLQYFKSLDLYGHVDALNDTFALLATGLDGVLPPGPEKDIALRALLTARDAAVRATVVLEEPKEEVKADG